jgi:hypothetical protein
MNNHVVSVIAVILGLICFGLRSVEGGTVFMLIALWIEISSAWRFYRKYRQPRKPATTPTKPTE